MYETELPITDSARIRNVPIRSPTGGDYLKA